MKQISILVLLLSTMLSSCKKESAYDECDTLADLYTPKGTVFGVTPALMDSIQFVYGSINPNDPNEVVYYGGKQPNWYMYVYNIATKQRTKISDHSPTHNIKWHKSGWICYATTDNNIYIVKPNGDSLRRLTTTGDCFTPEWNSTGEKIICFKAFNNTGNYIIHKDGSGIEIVLTDGKGIAQPCSWSPNDSIIISSPSNDVRCINYFTGEEKNAPNQMSGKVGSNGECWMHNGKEIVWCPDNQPAILDFQTGASRELLPPCKKMIYGYPSVTVDGRYALFNLNIGGYVGYNLTQTKCRLSRIDLTTNTETILELPE